MASQVPVYFVHGHVARPNAIALLGFPLQLDADAAFTRFFTCIDGQWGADDLPWRAVAVTAHVARDGTRSWWMMGRNGQTLQLSAQGRQFGQIPGAGLEVAAPCGYLEALRSIDGELFACGYGRQIYRHDGGEWQPHAEALLTRETARGFLSMAGASDGRLYAVGFQGEIFIHDPQGWRQAASPTTAHLHAITALDDGRMAVCGRDGVLLLGQGDEWQPVAVGSSTAHHYDIAWFQGQLYLAGQQQLSRVEGDRIVPVDTGLGRPVSTHKLGTCEGQLWSFGERDILMFDGQRWHEIVHPDNA